MPTDERLLLIASVLGGYASNPELVSKPPEFLASHAIALVNAVLERVGAPLVTDNLPTGVYHYEIYFRSSKNELGRQYWDGHRLDFYGEEHQAHCATIQQARERIRADMLAYGNTEDQYEILLVYKR